LNEIDLRNLMYTAGQKGNGVFAIRYPRGKGKLKDWELPFALLPVGKGRKLKDGKNIAVVSIGPIGDIAGEAIEKAKASGVDAAHYDMIYLKPIDTDLLHEIGKNYRRVVTVENGTITGGLGTAVMEFMSENGYAPEIKRIGIPDRFVPHGTIPELYRWCGMDADSILKELI
jgi:1-deoxy-D-xylulose-5-phosphate synthase